MKQFILTTPFDVEVKGQDVFLDGFISTIDQDLVNDVVTPNCLKSMLTQIKNRSIKLDIEHEAFKGKDNEETEIAKTKIPIGRLVDGAEDGKRLRVKGLLNKHHNRFSETKGSVTDGFLDAFSIAYIPTRVWHEEKNGQTVRMLDDVTLLNVALTGNPVNTAAQIRDIVMKSIDAVDEKGRNNPGAYGKVSDDSVGSGAIPANDDEEETKKKKKMAVQGKPIPNSTEEQEDEEDQEDKEKKKKMGKKANPIDEYKSDEANIEKLEVKNLTQKDVINLILSDEKLTNLVREKARSYSPNGANNQKEVKQMTEEETTTPEANEGEANAEAAADAGNGEAGEANEANADAGEGAETKSQEVAELKAQVAKLTETVDALLKAKDDVKSKAVAQQKAINEAGEIQPLDILA